MKTCVTLALGLALAGCGSSDLATVSADPASAPTSSLYTGRVVNDQGTQVPGVDVVLHERTSNSKHTAVTGADGSFTLDLPAGVYDLGLNNASDPSTATCFYGPITNPGSATPAFVLRGIGGRAAGSIFGQILLRPGTPASGRQLTLRPSLVHSGSDGTVPEPVQVLTSADGRFDTQLASSRSVSLDVEIFDNAGLDEWVDIGKLDKPCYAEFASEESPVENRLRANESDGPGELATASRAESEVRPKLESLFTLTTGSGAFSDWASLNNGLLTVDHVTKSTPANQYNISQLFANGTMPDPQSALIYTPTPIAVGDNGSWWWKYAVHVYHSLNQAGTHWDFTDQTGDTYSLEIYRLIPLPPIPIPVPAGWHKVSYNSKKPDINKVYFSL